MVASGMRSGGDCVLSKTEFIGLAKSQLKVDLTVEKVKETQGKAILSDGPQSLFFLVAGPGTGKTTALALRVLKLLLVEDSPQCRIQDGFPKMHKF